MDGHPPEDEYFVRVPAPPEATAGEAADDATVRPSGLARGASLGAVVGVLVAATISVVALLAGVLTRPDTATAPGPASERVAIAEADTSRSTDGGVPSVDGYQVWARNEDGSPVRWNPCAPIRWVVNLDGAPPGAAADLDRAVREVATVTGLTFRSLGETDERPARQRAPYQPGRYGDEGWAPVLVAWATPDETDVPLTASDRGVSIPVAVSGGAHDVFVSGQVVFNPDRPLGSGFGDRRTSWGATILHELGHTLGLDHVADPAQLMYTFPGEGPSRFGPGDLRGLRELGDGGCLDVPDPVDVDVTYVDDFGR